MKPNFSYSLLLLAAAFATATAEARIELPQVLSSGMVVQRNANVPLWGIADPGEQITVKVKNSKNKSVGAKKGYSTTADASGKWELSIPALPAGGPYTITLNDVVLSDVLSGDVLLCSGQSNMELQVSRTDDLLYDETSKYSNPNIRHFNTPNTYEFNTPKDDVNPTQWIAVTPESSRNFSATAYFTAKELYDRTGVPVGVIKTCWGGTPVEAWMSDEAIQPFPRTMAIKAIANDAAYRDQVNKTSAAGNRRWNVTLHSSDPGLQGNVKWFDPALDDSGWTMVDPVTNKCWATDGYNPVNGSHWFRKEINLTKAQASGDAILRMGCIVDADSVFVNGKLVGTTAYQYPPRIYKVPASVLREGRNNVTVRLISQYGTGSFVAEKPYKLITADGEVSLEGDWRYHLGVAMPNPPSGGETWFYKPTTLYNAMIHPFVKLPVAAAVWYQGESNVGRRNEYGPLLKAMIADWRKNFNQPEMPFYIVELANFLHPSDKGGRAAWAEMRDVQKSVADETPNTYLIKNYDLGEWNDIHPLNKKTLGERIAEAITSNTK